MNETPEQIYIDGLMIETSRKRGYGRYYFDNGDNAQDLNEYVRADLAAPDVAQLQDSVLNAVSDFLAHYETGPRFAKLLRNAIRQGFRNAKIFGSADAVRQARRETIEIAAGIVKESLNGDDALARLSDYAAALHVEGREREVND